MTRRWADVPTDVLAHYVSALLAPAGRYPRIRELVTSVGYLAEKLTRIGVGAVIDDVRTARRLAPTAHAADELAVVEVALTEAEQILRDEPGQLRGQLLARVTRSGSGDVSRLLDDASSWRDGIWLRPLAVVHNHGHLAVLGRTHGFVDAIAISDTGSLLLAGDRDGDLYAWDLPSRELVCRESTGTAVTALVFRPGSFEAFVGLDDGRVGRWSPADRRLRVAYRSEEHGVTSLAVDGDTLVFGAGPVLHAASEADRLRWRADTGQQHVTAVAITGAGGCCVSGGRDGSLVVWRLSDGRELRRLPATVDRVLCGAAVPGTDTVVVGGKDKRVVAVDAGTGIMRVLGRHANQVRSVAALDSRRVASGSYDGQVLIWDLAEGTSSRIGRHNGWCLAVAAARGGPVAAGGEDGRVRIWNPNAALAANLGKPIRTTLVVDGIAYGGTDRAVIRADVTTGSGLPRLTGHRRPVEALVRTPTGVASGSSDSTIRLWDTATSKALVLAGHRRTVLALAVTPDGSELVSVSLDGTWRRWDARTGTAGPVTEGRGPYNSVLTLSPDGELVITATIDHVIEVWNRRSGRLALPALTGHAGYVEGLAVTPDGNTLISGSWDRTLRFWSLANGKLVQTLSFDEWIVELAMTADGRLVAAYGADGAVILVDTATRTVRSTLDLGGRAYGRLALSPDDRTLFVLHNYELQAWDIHRATLLARFDADVPLRCLAVAGPDMVVIGTGIGTLVPVQLVSPVHPPPPASRPAMRSTVD